MEAHQLLPTSLQVEEVDESKSRRSGFFHSLGWFGIICLTFGSTVLASSFGFILFLWKANESNEVWQHIILAAWLTRVITLSSLLIRVIAGALAALSTSMLAALSLQQYYILLPDAAAATLIQFQNPGPQSLAVLLSRSLRTGRGFGIAMLVFVLWISTTILQFSSTILLFDVKNEMVRGFQQNRTLPYALDGSSQLRFMLSQATDVQGYWTTSPAAYPAFAEYAEPPDSLDGVHDTGLSMRAFLPFPLKQQRDLLNQYKGWATVVDSRVVCMRPSLEDVVISLVVQPYESGGMTFDPSPGFAPSFIGRVGTNFTAPKFKVVNASDHFTLSGNETAPLQPFNCPSAYSGGDGADEWPLVFCKVFQSRGIISAMQTLPDAEEGGIDDYLNQVPGASYLVFNISGPWDKWSYYSNEANNVSNAYTIIDPSDPPEKANLTFLGSEGYESNGEWLRIPSNDPEIYVSVSICYTAFNAANFQVQVSSSVNTTEPTIGWNQEAGKFTTEAIQNQLGTLDANASLSSRGVLSLQPLSSWLAPIYGVNSTVAITAIANSNQYTNYSQLACYDCASAVDSSLFTIINPQLSAIFGDIIRNTGHPALALQGLFTVLFGTMYYAVIQQFDVSTNATIVAFVDSARPVAWRGLTIVAVTVTAHLLVVGATLILFMRKGYPGVVGSAWPVLAQLRGKEIEEWIDQTGESRDREVVTAIKRRGAAKHWIGVNSPHHRLGREEGANKHDR